MKDPDQNDDAGLDGVSHFLSSLAVIYGVVIVERTLGVCRVFIFAGLLDSEGYGAFSLAMTVTGLMLPLATLGIPSAFSRYVPEYENRGSLHVFFRRSVSFVAVATVVLVVAMFTGAPRISIWVYQQPSYANLIRMSAGVLAFYSFYAFGLAALRGLHMFRSSSLLELLKTSVFTGTGVVLLLSAGAKPQWALAANMAAFGAVAIIFMAILISRRRVWRRTGDIEPPGPFRARLLSFSSAYIVNAFLFEAFIFLSKWMATFFGSLSETGILSLSMDFAQMMLILITAINLVLGPIFSRMWVQGRRGEARQMLHLTLKLTLLLMLCASAVADRAATFLIPIWKVEFVPALDLIRILLAAQLFNASVWTFGQWANLVERPRLKLLASGMGLATLAALGAHLGDSMATQGVAWAFLGAHFTTLAVTLYYVSRIGLPVGRSGVLAVMAPCLLVVPGWGCLAACLAVVAVAIFTPAIFTSAERAILGDTIRVTIGKFRRQKP